MGPHSKMASSLLQLAHQLGPNLRHYGRRVPLEFPRLGAPIRLFIIITDFFEYNFSPVCLPGHTEMVNSYGQLTRELSPVCSTFKVCLDSFSSVSLSVKSRAVCPSSDARRFPNFFPRSTSAAIMYRLSLPFFITI
jgi:hypothetical protein